MLTRSPGKSTAGSVRRSARAKQAAGKSAKARKRTKAATGINIKNAETIGLIAELAKETGEGKTEAISKAVAARLEQVRREKKDGRVEELMRLAKEIHELLGPGPAPDIDALLYDPVTGLPRED
jgi:antitoxin VapB